MGIIILLTWESPQNFLNLQVFPMTSSLAMGQEVKGNLLNGTQVVNKKTDRGYNPLSIQNKKKF